MRLPHGHFVRTPHEAVYRRRPSGKTSHYCQVELKQNMMNSDLVTFELWDEKLSTIAKNDLTSAISIAEVYWQGLDS